MIKDEYNVIGVMSGTSLDGIDIALINFKLNNSWSFKIIEAETIGYDEQWLRKLIDLVTYSDEVLSKLDIEYTLYFQWAFFFKDI